MTDGRAGIVCRMDLTWSDLTTLVLLVGLTLRLVRLATVDTVALPVREAVRKVGLRLEA